MTSAAYWPHGSPPAPHGGLLVNLPIIAPCNTECPPCFVDTAIPCSNRGALCESEGKDDGPGKFCACAAPFPTSGGERPCLTSSSGRLLRGTSFAAAERDWSGRNPKVPGLLQLPNLLVLAPMWQTCLREWAPSCLFSPSQQKTAALHRYWGLDRS